MRPRDPRLSSAELARLFDAEGLAGLPGERYNVAPTQDLAVVVERDGRRAVTAYRWGLVPHWSDGPRAGARMINARAETVAVSPGYRDSFGRKRSIVPVDGFYEWQRLPDGRRQPVYVTHADGAPLALAGLWSSWRPVDDAPTLRCCPIVTTTPNELLAPIHDRMPAILPPEAWVRWLDAETQDRGELRALLRPAPPEGLVAYPVSSRVNRVANDGADLTAPLPVVA